MKLLSDPILEIQVRLRRPSYWISVSPSCICLSVVVVRISPSVSSQYKQAKFESLFNQHKWLWYFIKQAKLESHSVIDNQARTRDNGA